jgi:hypothetical protein
MAGRSLINYIRNMKTNPSCQVFMNVLRDTVFSKGLTGAYVRPGVFCPIPFWSKTRCLKELTVVFDGEFATVSLESILANAWGVNTFWVTGKNDNRSLFERGSHSQVRPNSLWCRMLNELNAKLDRGLQPAPGLIIAVDSDSGLQPARRPYTTDWSGLQPARRVRFKGKQPDPCLPVQNPLPWSVVENAAGTPTTDFRMRPHANPVLAAWDDSTIKKSCRLIRKIGSGTFGRVYLAKSFGQQENVAVKVCRSHRMNKPVSPTEVAFLSRLRGHSNIIQMRDFFWSPYFCVAVLELMDCDLWCLLERCPLGGLQSECAEFVTREVARGVAHMHAIDMFHRDLHPGNILFRLRRVSVIKYD